MVIGVFLGGRKQNGRGEGFINVCKFRYQKSSYKDYSFMLFNVTVKLKSALGGISGADPRLP